MHTRMSLMAKQEYEPTPDEIRAMCLVIRAERLEAMSERPEPQQRRGETCRHANAVRPSPSVNIKNSRDRRYNLLYRLLLLKKTRQS